MGASLIDGKTIAEAMRLRIRSNVETLVQIHGFVPGLAVVLVGNNPASAVYVRNKAKQAESAGMRSRQYILPDDVTEPELLALIGRLNVDDDIDGILVQLPLPAHIGRWRVLEAISPGKDVDGFHPYNAGRLAVGKPNLAPCTPLGVVHLIKTVAADLKGLDVLVIGRSNIVGKPLGILLGDEGCTVVSAQLETRNLQQLCRWADIVVAAAGSPGLVRGEWLKPGAIVIDVGINRVIDAATGQARLTGDVEFEEAAKRAAHITPVPGGVGPMTIAYLLGNTLAAAIRRRRIDAVPHPDEIGEDGAASDASLETLVSA